ncbi:maltooligosyl trehalose synthase [Paracoccus thiocyanatus]|uniref:Maltooligosyl trehalose synthase n=1 Tax=Paracoccus thiocyanatus TaxID=34006 RepID=A0A1N6W096_9RHOB|nr:malto-oligosyltrehalose synthase [Paracoccus thiocyanatus]SIQ83484.1 maltooligosyl trehalose synthase [Paracoccus thiocyanatus]
MTKTLPLATYRIQLRGGLGFAELAGHLDYLAGLGVSHLYLSPIFAAVAGSSHGYDITDPTAIDPVLGGRQGFEALARAAQARALGIILDIVPNHAAFSLENPWLLDVLRQGRRSPHAQVFDIDWQAGPLVLPFLPEPFEKLLAEGAFHVRDGHWCWGDLRLPLAEGRETGDLRQLHDAQHWRLAHSELERDGITHRRFFNVTGLIGLRVEDPAVFRVTHGLVLDLVRQGLVQGLRVDHIDGLADPGGYLDRLRAALPETPLWVEKILVGDETLPPGWPITGTTGYEHARLMARLLTDAGGIRRLDRIWRKATGEAGDFCDTLRQAKLDVLEHELAAERRQLRDLAAAAAQGSELAEPGPESLREAVTALLVEMPRYRTYLEGPPRDEDRRILLDAAGRAAAGLRSRAVLDMVVDLMLHPAGPAADQFLRRFQQVSGALLAKAQEDTAGFRWSRYLAANEVGAEPDEPTVTVSAANAALARGRAGDLVPVSTHDTKRSGDARMRLAAISHLPQAFKALYRAAEALPGAAAVQPRWRWYALQSALTLWDGASPVAQRLQDHLQKAMREAKLTSFWLNPDEDAERGAGRFAAQVLAQWQAAPPPELAALVTRAQALALAQRAFQMLWPGIPDLYRGDETGFLALTDPDNRRPLDWRALAGSRDPKARWTRALLDLRADRRDFLDAAGARVETAAQGLRLLREARGDRLAAEICHAAPDISPDGILLCQDFADGCRVMVHESRSKV